MFFPSFLGGYTMKRFDGFEEITPELIYKNELLYHARRQTELLEQIAQLLQQPKKTLVDRGVQTNDNRKRLRQG